jgi:colicin import membrane protein
MNTEMVEIKDISLENAPAIYVPKGLDAYYEAAKRATDEVPDLSTSKGRKRVASLSAQVSSSKTGVINTGKKYLKELKAAPQIVQDEMNEFIVKMGALRDERRKPLSDWEAEQVKIAADELAAQKAEEAAIKKENDQEFALLMNDKFDSDAREEARQLEERVQEEAFRLKTEKEEQARADEQFRINQEKARVEREDRIRKEAAEKAEADKEAAISRQKAAEEATELVEKRRVEQEAQAKLDIAAAAEQSRLDQIAEQEAKEAQAQADLKKLEANKQHVGKIRKAAKESLMSLGLPEALAKTVVLAISKKQIDHVHINY